MPGGRKAGDQRPEIKGTDRIRTRPLKLGDSTTPADQLSLGTKNKARIPDLMSGDASRLTTSSRFEI
jgi:hypothetical protein